MPFPIDDKKDHRPKGWGGVEHWLQHHPRMSFVCWVLTVAGVGFLAVHTWGTRTLLRAELAGYSALRSALTEPEFHGHVVDWWIYPGCFLVATGSVVGAAVAVRPSAQRLFRAATVTMVGIAFVHLGETLMLLGKECPPPKVCSGLGPWPLWIQFTAFLLYTLTPAAVVIAFVGACTAAKRAWFTKGRRHGCAMYGPTVGPLVERAKVSHGGMTTRRGEHWWHNSAVPEPSEETDSPPFAPDPSSTPPQGVCFSGGGIRSATFALGALQALQEGGEFNDTAYLSAVSGGSYMAGALLFAQQGDHASGGPGTDHGRGNGTPDPEMVFAPGSDEFDHLRRHANYIARTPKEWLIAFVVVLRGATISALFLAALAFVAGRWVGHFYYESWRGADFEDPGSPAWGFIAPGAVFAVVALVFWLCAKVRRRKEPTSDEGDTVDDRGLLMRNLAEGLMWVTALLAVAGAVVPVVVWASEYLVHHASLLGVQEDQTPSKVFGGGALGALGVAISAMGLWRSRMTELRETVRPQAHRKFIQRFGDSGRRALQWIAVYGGLALVVGVYLTVFGVSAHAAANVAPMQNIASTRGDPHFVTPVPNIAFTAGVTLLLLVFCLVVDETDLGLHPYYRTRLGRAFAICPRAEGRRDGGPTVTARDERSAAWSWLHEYDGHHHPQILFCAAAHSNDENDIHPGRAALPFTFSHDVIGGPDGGWVKVPDLHDLFVDSGARGHDRFKCLARDLTVETAMAVSGAAFSSAMGKYSSPSEVLLSLSNMRLGTWVVNPAYVTKDHYWWEPPLPRTRPMSYMLREIFGIYPASGPLIFVTDGAHYEFLGLMELFRRRCRTIYCFDASSDRLAFAASLADSVALASEELGVTIELDEPDRARPHGFAPAPAQPPSSDGAGDGSSASPPSMASSTPADAAAQAQNGSPDGSAPMDALQAKIADTPVITGRFRYPEDKSGDPDGLLVIGRTTLDPTTPWWIQRYAEENELFPYDATGDQFFDVDKFNAYTGLGRHVGKAAAKAKREKTTSGGGRRTSVLWLRIT